MAGHPEPSLDDHLWTIALARLVLPAAVAVQAPPNLAEDEFPRLLEAGIDDWGGVSPVTLDHVNPEAPWPERERLAAATARAARARAAPGRAPALPRRRAGSRRRSAAALPPPTRRPGPRRRLARARRAGRLPVRVRRRGLPVDTAPSWTRRSRRCSAPAARSASACSTPPTGAARGPRRRGHLRRHAEHQLHQRLLLPLRLLRLLEGPPGREPARPAVPRAARRDRAPRAEAWDRGATEICLQGGIHPAFTGDFYLVVGRSRPSCPTCTCTPSARSRSGRAPRRSGWSLERLPRAAARRRPRLAARHRGGDPRRRGARGALPGQDLHGAVARGP